MSLGLIGRKVGMTRVFTVEGNSIPVTVLEIIPNRVTQIKNIKNDGYDSLQISYGQKKPNKLSKSLAGLYAKIGTEDLKLVKQYKKHRNYCNKLKKKCSERNYS